MKLGNDSEHFSSTNETVWNRIGLFMTPGLLSTSTVVPRRMPEHHNQRFGDAAWANRI